MRILMLGSAPMAAEAAAWPRGPFDLVLAIMLLIGSVTGAQLGTRISRKMRPEYLRIILAFIVLVVAIRMALGLGWRPDEIYTIEAG